MSDDEADPELLELLRQHFMKSAVIEVPETHVLDGAEYVYNNSIDVAIDYQSTKAAATMIYEEMQKKEYSTQTWSVHELHPKEKNERTVDFIFTMDLLNFSFWSENPDDERFAIEYRSKKWTGYWSLVAALQRALDEDIPVTSSDFWQNELECTEEVMKHVFRSCTEEEIPMFAERLSCLREAGRVLYEKYECRFSRCIEAANHSAAALVNLLAKDFPCFNDAAQFEGRKTVRFLKRAQICVADIWAAFNGEGYGQFNDIDKITMFADYRVPQILNTLGCLWYSPPLEHTIRQKKPIESGHTWEIQLRGCSIWCVELIRREILRQHPDAKVNAILIDFFLYDTMKEREAERKEEIPHHRTRYFLIMGQKYKEMAAIAQKRRDDAIPTEYLLKNISKADLPRNLTGIHRSSGHFTPEELQIIETEPEGILSNIKQGKWTSLEVTKAFCKSAVVAQQLTNCLTEILFKEAFDRAQFLDSYLKRTGKTIGPLHGLPISLKDCMIVPPHPASVGMACYANEPTKPEDETILVTLLRKLGAVFYVKTTTPTAMMMMETISNVWGETNNAYQSGTSPGGSSGGEGALISLKGSPLGIGTDIGGSIRLPSAFNNLYGLKPTFGRFPGYGSKSGIPGQDFIYANNGPMARSLESLKIYCKAVLSQEAAPWLYDPKCFAIPWREDVIPKGRKLRIGIISDNDGEITVHPPIIRGLAMTKKALEAAGHEVFEWTPISHPEIVKGVNEAFFTLGGAAIIGLTKQNEEPVFGSMKPYEEIYNKGEAGTLGPTKLREMIYQRNAYQKQYVDHWTATAVDGKEPMDAIITATSPWTAPRLGITQKLFCINYTGVWNLLDYPVCTFPVTFADKNIDKKRDSWVPLNDLDAGIQADYDPEFYDGTPVVLQCVGRRFEDEKVLDMTSIIADALKAHS
ncbi:hypothetical protein B7463_g4938, partial [Scytalidium lignicola]